MAMTNAERQEAYRQRHLKDVRGQGERLNMIVGLQAKAALERLAHCYGVTQKDVIERVLIEAERVAVQRAAEFGRENDYYNKKWVIGIEPVTR